MGVQVRRPVEGEVHVHYGQIYVESDPGSYGPDLAEAFAGQSAGLCGAASSGELWLITGLHTGDVGFTVEVHEEAPWLGTEWEDVVEVSFRPASGSSALVQWAGEASWKLGLEVRDYRVRYCATGMDEARRRDTRLQGEPLLDRYLLQFWPSPHEPDRVVRQTSAAAAYWHDYARQQAPPPTPAQRAETERRARLAQAHAEREHRLQRERWEWGGRLPSEALRDVRGNVRGLLRFDPSLVHAIGAADPATQRAVALLAARRACEAAGLAGLDWIAAGLTALAEGQPLPPPFDDTAGVWQTLRNDLRVPGKTVGQAIPPQRPPFRPSAHDARQMPMPKPGHASRPGGPVVAGTSTTRPNSPPRRRPADATSSTLRVTIGPQDPSVPVSQPHMAVSALLGAGATDPLQAALDAVHGAVTTYGEDYPTLLEEVRTSCQKGT